MPEAFILGTSFWGFMLTKRTCRKRTKELNKKNFPSERWFERLLFEHQIGGYQRNPALIERYFGDFVWFETRIIVEIDGISHLGKENYDAKRDEALRSAGYSVHRIKYGDRDAAVEIIRTIKILLEYGSNNWQKIVYPKRIKRPKIKKIKNKKKLKRPGHAVAKCFTDDNKRTLDDLDRRKKLWIHPRKRK